MLTYSCTNRSLLNENWMLYRLLWPGILPVATARAFNGISYNISGVPPAESSTTVMNKLCPVKKKKKIYFFISKFDDSK